MTRYGRLFLTALLCLGLLLSLAACGGAPAAEKAAPAEEPAPAAEAAPAAEKGNAFLGDAPRDGAPAEPSPLAGRYVLVSIRIEDEDLGGVIGPYLDLNGDLTGVMYMGETFGLDREAEVVLDPEKGVITAIVDGERDDAPCAVEGDDVITVDLGDGSALVFAKEGSHLAKGLSDGLFAQAAAAGFADGTEVPEGDVPLYEDDAIALTATGLKEDEWGDWGLYLRAENKTDEDLSLTSDGVVVNGGAYMSGALYMNLPAGTTSADCLMLYEDHLAAAGVEEITSLYVDLRAYNDDYHTVSEGGGYYYPQGEDAAGEPLTFDPEAAGAKLLAEGGGCAVYQLSAGLVEDEIWGDRFVLRVALVNGTGNRVMFNIEDGTVNGEELDPFWAWELLPNSFSVTDIPYSEYSLEELGIGPADVTDVTVIFEAYNSDDYSEPDYFETDVAIVPD